MDNDILNGIVNVLERHSQQLATITNTPTMDLADAVTRKLTIVRERHALSLKIAAVTPEESPGLLWEMQNLLLLEAQQQLGPRTPSKKIYQPTFEADAQPCVRFAKSYDGAWAEMTADAAGNWRLCIWQLAHETVHLLDQTPGTEASVLEEGVAVAFAHHACSMFGFEIRRAAMANYAQACTLVKRLPGGIVAAGRLRQFAGSFDNVTVEHLVQLGVSQSDAALYTQPFAALAVPPTLRLVA